MTINKELSELSETMAMGRPEGTLSRSEVLELPVIKLAREGDAKALEYLREWSPKGRGGEEKDPSRMTLTELILYCLEDLKALRLEKRKRELRGGTA